jgi:hypothetical protein
MHFGVVTGIFPGQEAFLLELTPTSRRNAVDRGLGVGGGAAGGAEHRHDLLDGGGVLGRVSRMGG